MNWRQALKVFFDVSIWIVVPILVALVLGKSLDAHFGTKPIIFLILAGIGFLFSCFGIVRIIRNYMKQITELSKTDKE